MSFLLCDIDTQKTQKVINQIAYLNVEEINYIKEYCDKMLRNSGYHIAKYYNEHPLKGG